MTNVLLLNTSEFYPSITKKVVNEALKLAKECTRISEEKMNITKHCRKFLLYHNEESWIKKRSL